MKIFLEKFRRKIQTGHSVDHRNGIDIPFDDNFYSIQCEKRKIICPMGSSRKFVHFMRHGFNMDISPHPMFDVSFIKKRAKTFGDLTTDQLFLKILDGEIDPHPLFSNSFYRSAYPDIKSAKISPFRHFIDFGIDEGRDPSPYVCSKFFYASLADSNLSKRELIFQLFADSNNFVNYSHPLFKADWYVDNVPPRYRENAAAQPLIHFATIGDRKAFSPHPLVNLRAYLSSNFDVFLANKRPFAHLWVYGIRESRPFLKTSMMKLVEEITTRLQNSAPIEIALAGGFAWLQQPLEIAVRRYPFTVLKKLKDTDDYATLSSENSNYTFPEPRFGSHKIPCASYEHQRMDSGVYIANNVYAFGGSNLLLSAANNAVYVATRDPSLEKLWHPRGQICADNIDSHSMRIRIGQSSGKQFATGFLLCSEGDSNYFHWLIEVLPRTLWLLKDGIIPLDVPVVITANIHQNLKSTLLKLLEPKREIIELQNTVPSFFRELYVPFNENNYISDNYFGPIKSGVDVRLDPNSLKALRKNLCGNATGLAHHDSIGLRLLIKRPKSSVRHPGNFHELEDALCSLGFTVCDPSTLSFEEQIKLFKRAECVVSPTGAALANIMFCRPDTDVIVLFGLHPSSNYYIFSHLAEIFGLNLINILCPLIPIDQRKIPPLYSVHENYSIPIDEVLDQLQAIFQKKRKQRDSQKS